MEPSLTGSPTQARAATPALPTPAKRARLPANRPARPAWRLAYTLPEAHNPRVRRVMSHPAEELPATVIRVVRDKKDRSTLEHRRVVIDAVLGVSANGQRSTISPRVRRPNGPRISCDDSSATHNPTIPLELKRPPAACACWATAEQ